MKSVFRHCAAVLLASASFTVSMKPAQAADVVFSFSSPSPVNFPSTALPLTQTVAGITGSITNPTGTDQPALSLFNTNPNGLCVFYNNNGSTTRRCGSTPTNGGTDNTTLTGFTASFNTDVFLKSFRITQYENLASGSLSFQAGSNSQSFSFSGIGTQTFANAFYVPALTPITIASSGTIGPDLGLSGAFRLTDFTIEAVPGPLPILGAATALGWSRKLKSRIKAHKKSYTKV